MISRSIESILAFLSYLCSFLHTFHLTDCNDVQGPAHAHVCMGPPSAGEPGAEASLQLYSALVPQPGWRAVSDLMFFSDLKWVLWGLLS